MKFFAWLNYWIRTAVAASSRKEFYRRLENRRALEALGHIALLTAFLWVLPFLVVFFVGMRQAAGSFMDGLHARVPAGTVFETQHGTFSDTLAAPLVFGGSDYKVIVNTATSTLTLNDGDTGLAIGQTGIVQQDGTERKEIAFAKLPAFRWTREDMLDNAARWAPLALFLFALLACVAVFSLYFAGFIASVLAHALVLWLAFKAAKRPWPWRRAFVAAAYAATLPIFLNALLSALDLNLGFIPNLLYWVILAWILYDAIKRSPAPGKGGSDERKENVDRPDEGGRPLA